MFLKKEFEILESKKKSRILLSMNYRLGFIMNVYDLVKRLLDGLDGSVEIFNITIGNDIILVHTLDNKIITFRKQSKAEPRVRIELNNGRIEYYCGRCGNKISNDDVYCSKCGMVLYRKIEKCD